MPSNFKAMVQTYQGAHADWLGNRHFMATLLAALLLHCMVAYLWYLMPRQQVIDVPVRALNIKLGDGDLLSQEDMNSAQAEPANKVDVENAISRLVREPNPPAPDKAPIVAEKSMGKAKVVGKFDVRQEGNKTAAPVMMVEARQFVRELPPLQSKPAADSKPAEPLGNSTSKDAEMIARYEQLISLWIQKFKIYPEAARKERMQGSTVVRIRIDRRGNVHFYQLERSTGHSDLDRAAIDMIRRANPVPAVPNEYPKGELLEFLIPVSFEMK